MVKVADQLEVIEARIMSGLKDFQKATVLRVDHLFRNKQRRVLVSDEVGLGKTMIARGTVAKLARLRREEGDALVKVVYICSNAAIADQNLRKLRVSHEVQTESASSSRLSMQHLNIYRQEHNPDLLARYIQLIPLTPDTSFRMTAGAGTVEERALMYAHLKRLPELRRYQSELEVAMQNNASASWESRRDAYEKEATACNQASGGRYFREMRRKLEKELACTWNDPVTFLDGVRELCRRIRRNKGKRVDDIAIIGQLRVIFAKISIDKLEPDLVIMDEFQRFRFLLDCDPHTEAGMLAQRFFQSKDTRMLLLSATPYKMYSTPEEIDEASLDEHYTEFLAVMRFLNDNQEDDNRFRTVWTDYSIKLKELTVGDTTILSAKRAAEKELYRMVCRTERISEPVSADLIDDSTVRESLPVSEQDIRSYLQIQNLLDQIGETLSVPVDYVKFSPYLMSFMKEYQLKRRLERYFRENPGQLWRMDQDTFWIDRAVIDRYEPLPGNNARLERVMHEALQDGMEHLLWIPPSRPYYEMQGVFQHAEHASKTLVFSAWEMVPRMLSCLLSYEAERRTVGKLARERMDREVHYFSSADKRYPPARLNYSVRNGVPASMTLFCLLYPSKYLSECYDPVACMNAGMGIREIQEQIRETITERLKEFPSPEYRTSDRGARWYYLVPLLLDAPEYAQAWLASGEQLADEKGNDEEEEGAQNQKGFRPHLNRLRELYAQSRRENLRNLGKRPDDLVDVLTDLAIAAPAICVLRTYQRYLTEDEELPCYLPSALARVFLNRMNRVESTAVVELSCGRGAERNEVHWRNLLTYCRQGNLQAVFDEYAHLLSNGIDRDEQLIEQIHRQMKEAMDIRTTHYEVDTYPSFQRRAKGEKEPAEESRRIRSHFAAAFTKGEGKDSDTDRKKTLRNAFNSPFRPFVLSTTSIGQEGLDFHNYCRRIVHWNLPSNPIDLEQREGRINRFECLAIRQNVAKRYRKTVFHQDIWEEMFQEAARAEKAAVSSDLIPFWGLKASEDMVMIERIVPMYPFSRDKLAYERLMTILSLYRLTLGHARQEELLEYLFRHCEDANQLKELFINLSPFYLSKRNGCESVQKMPK